MIFCFKIDLNRTTNAPVFTYKIYITQAIYIGHHKNPKEFASVSSGKWLGHISDSSILIFLKSFRAHARKSTNLLNRSLNHGVEPQVDDVMSCSIAQAI